jgi:hypothetical protein
VISRRGRAKGQSSPGAHPGPAPTAVRDPVRGWTACLPDPTTARPWAEPFAEDLRRACTQAFDAFAGSESPTPLTLPISVPFDEHGVVVLSSAPPKPDAPRVPAELELVAGSPPSTPYRFGLALARVDRQPLLVPGVTGAGPGTPTEPLPLTLLTFALTHRGMAIAGYDAHGRLTPLTLDETTARALAVALLITIGVKLTKAGYSG